MSVFSEAFVNEGKSNQRRRPRDFDPIEVRAAKIDGSSTEMMYRDFLLKRCGPYLFWQITKDDKEVLGLGGWYTVHTVAQRAIDEYLSNEEKTYNKSN